jgi:hypothetical protein
MDLLTIGAFARLARLSPKPCARTEHDVALGDDAVAVPGTVTVPRGDLLWPAVVLLAGSGPNDRDGTLGPSKPLKDLAWGLASSGIAVLRFETVARSGLFAAWIP